MHNKTSLIYFSVPLPSTVNKCSEKCHNVPFYINTLYISNNYYFCRDKLILAELLSECSIVNYSIVDVKQIKSIFDLSF